MADPQAEACCRGTSRQLRGAWLGRAPSASQEQQHRSALAPLLHHCNHLQGRRWLERQKLLGTEHGDMR